MKHNHSDTKHRIIYKRLAYLLLIVLMISVVSCEWPAKKYDEINSIKWEALALIDKSSTDSFSDHKEEVAKLDKRIDDLIASKKPKIGVKALKLINDKKMHTWGGFTKLWEEQGKLSTAAVPSAKKNVAQAFDEVLAMGRTGGISLASIK